MRFAQIQIETTGAAGWLVERLTRILGELFAIFSPFGTDSRFHWTGLAAFAVLGLGVWLFSERRRSGECANPLSFLFPLSLYRTASSWVDVKVYLAGQLMKPLVATITLPASALAMAAVAGMVETARGTQGTEPEMWALIAASLLVAVVFDLAYYVTHRISHENRWLWPFHKLHHSAEVLTPITAKRNHPVYNILLGFVNALIAAPVAGVIFGLFGVVDFTRIFGVTLLIALMNVTGGALRHSHIWLDFGPVMDRILISPAQHQIHHSLEPRHHDKNYGLTLAIWDWMFGTLYVPEKREKLTFGVADREGTPYPQMHNSLTEAYIVPFKEVAEVARERGEPQQVEERA